MARDDDKLSLHLFLRNSSPTTLTCMLRIQTKSSATVLNYTSVKSLRICQISSRLQTVSILLVRKQPSKMALKNHLITKTKLRLSTKTIKYIAFCLYNDYFLARWSINSPPRPQNVSLSILRRRLVMIINYTLHLMRFYSIFATIVCKNLMLQWWYIYLRLPAS